jgi:FtsH-binding integral membrane protein
MALDTNRSRVWTGTSAEAAQIDVGLRRYMLGVYNYMASGLALTGVTAMVVANTPAIRDVFFAQTARGVAPTIIGWIAIVAPILLVFALSAGVNRMRGSTAQTLFWVYAGLMGVSIASILLAYTGVSVARVFFITAATFGALSLYGYTTKRDLTGFGRFLFMGLVGLIIAGVVNIFLQSAMVYFVYSVVGVLLFAGLTAYDTQKIKELYFAGDSSEVLTVKSVNGALRLYLDFINLFIMLIQLMGDRRQ